MRSLKGFAEDQKPFEAINGLASVDHAPLRLDGAGRIVIPADMRAAMLATPGDTLTARVVEGELRIVSRAWVLRRFEEEAARSKAANPGDSAVDELIAERREEARRDDERWTRLEREAGELRDTSERR